MSAGHDHSGQAARAGARHRGRLWAAFAITGGYMAVEAVAGWWTGSLALLSDAGHMFTDVLGLGMALAAITAASSAGRGIQRTFGLYRLEVLAALANAVLLFGVAGWVLYEAVHRFQEPPEVHSGGMLTVAVVGLLANLVSFWLLRSAASESLNIRGAYLEVVGDLLGSAGVLVAGLIIATTGWAYADPIIAAAVGVFILPRTYQLARSAVKILVQAAPDGLDMTAVRKRLAGVPGVLDVHDLHAWRLTSGMDVASAHLTVATDSGVVAVLAAARSALHEDFGIEHATLQIEPRAAAEVCHDVGW